MPILPENKHLYPKNWDEISARIKERDGNACKFCKVPNYSIGYRQKDGQFIHIEQSHQGDIDAMEAIQDGYKIIKIVLTVMHLDHNPENCDDNNLASGCQRCHNKYDAPHRAKTRKRNKYTGMKTLF